jgi:ferredoxin
LLESCSNLLPVAVEELASVGPEIWLLSLAFGARRVLLMDDLSEPEQVRVGLGGQLEMIGEILAAMGYPAAAVSRFGPGDSVELEEGAMPSMAPAVHAIMEDKRGNFYLALDHLHARAVKSKTMANLSVGAAFGAVFVEPKACTLCMACVSVCPGNALQDGGGEPRLGFVEANCIQCGLCTRTCPEDAIWITPRLLFDRESRNTPKVLHQEEPFCCVTCGKPFATRSVIDHVMSKLSGHSMFRDDRARQRLMMCEDCRVVDVVQDQEAMQKGQIPR